MRFEVIEDAGEWILDQETGEYMDMYEACQKLNELEESMDCVGSVFRSVVRGLDGDV